MIRLPLGRLTVLVLLAMAILSPRARAQADSGSRTPPDTTPQAGPGAPVVLRGDTLFEIRTRLGPFTAARRAEAVRARLDQILHEPLLRRDSLTVLEGEGTTDVMLGDLIITTVTAADAVAEGKTRAVLAQERALRISAALAGGSFWTIVKAILLGALFTLLATAVLVLALKGLNRSYRLVSLKLESWRSTRIPALRLQRLEVLSATRMTDLLKGAARVFRIAAIVILLYFYLPLVLSFFPWTRGVASNIFGWVTDPLKQVGTSFLSYLPNVFFIAVIVLVIRYVLKFVHLVFQGIAGGTLALPNFPPDWAEPTYKIVRFLIIMFGVVIVFPYLPGSGSDAFRGVSVFVGVLFSLGSSSAIANVVAGVVLTYMRPFRVGDRVKIADTIGDVVEKTLLVTRIRTIKNTDITVPNAMVLSSHIVNYSSSARDRGLILHTGVTIGYDVPWRQVHELLLAAAGATEGIRDMPKPFVLQTSLDDFYVSYELNAYTETPGVMAGIYSELHQQIQDKFNEAGVEIMSPHYGAQRDGNTIAIPEDYRAEGYEAPAFRLERLGGHRPAEGRS